MVLTEAACYQLLELPTGAPLDEVRRAYRALARRLHPDVRPGHEVRFKRITAAYNFLTGRAKARKASATSTQSPPPAPAPASTSYARTARPGPTARRATPPPRTARSTPPPARTQAGADEPVDHARAWAEWRLRAARIRMEETLGSEVPAVEPEAPVEAAPTTAERTADAERCPHCGDSHDRQARPERTPRTKRGVFGRLRDRLRRPKPAPVPVVHLRGDDVTLRLPLDIESVMNGASRTIGISRAAACPSCERGGDAECVCGGSGRVKLREKVKVQIPAGARAGQKLRLPGKGTAGLFGEADGDLYLLLEAADIPGFRREGSDLVGTVDLDRRLARKGGPLEVSLGSGKVRLTVPAGTRTGDRFRLRGQGLPTFGGGPRGDVFLVVGLR